MKRLEEFIVEKLKISKIEIKYHPNSKEELVDLIIKEIEANGPECSLNHIDVSNITDMSFLFRGAEPSQYYQGKTILSDFDGDISTWNVSKVTNMRSMFSDCNYSGKNGDISNWGVSNVTDMRAMFSRSKYNGDISNWDVSKVTDMAFLFHDSVFTGKNGDISDWDVSNVTNMSYMFDKSKYNGDISNWDVSSVKRFDQMFRDSSFDGDISKWQINPKAKGGMDEMFLKSPLEKTPPVWYNKYSK